MLVCKQEGAKLVLSNRNQLSVACESECAVPADWISVFISNEEDNVDKSV